MSGRYTKAFVALLLIVGAGMGVLHLRPDWALLGMMHLERGRADFEQKTIQDEDHTVMYLE